jgi:quercetin dioxygenase-like cupin family protein
MGKRVTFRAPGGGSTMRLGPGEYLTDKATGDDTDGHYTLFEVHSAQESGVPLHEHAWDEAFYVLDGEYDISYVDEDDEVRHVAATPGTFVHVPGGAIHAYKNVAEGFSRMLSINQPVGLEPLVALLGLPCAGPGEPPAREPVSTEEFRATFTEYGVRVQQDRLGPGGGPGAWKDEGGVAR